MFKRGGFSLPGNDVRIRWSHWAFMGVCTLASSVAQADFRSELSAGYGESVGFGSQAQLVDATARVFLAPVNDSKGPYALARFLSRASDLTYNFSHTEVDDFDTNVHSLSARYVDVNSGWLGGVSASYSSLPDAQFELSTGGDASGYGVTATLGKYLWRTTTLALTGGFANQDSDFNGSLECPEALITLGCVGIDFDSATVTDEWSIATRLQHVGQIGRTTIAIDLGVGYSSVDVDSTALTEVVLIDDTFAGLFPPTETQASESFDDNWAANLAGTWFVNRSVGLGLGYEFDRQLGTSIHTFSSSASWFITRNVEVRGSYRLGFLANSSADNDTWEVSLRARF